MTKNKQQALRENAAHWCIVMDSGQASSAEKKAFADWITKDPAHMREYNLVHALWAEAAMFGGTLDPASDVITLFPQEVDGRAKSAPVRHRSGRLLRVGHLAAAVLIALFLGLGAIVLVGDDPLEWAFGPGVEHFSTRKGESRLVSLSDGSVVEMNTQSEIEVRYGRHVREIRLLRGEAYFDVAKDPQRPFLVNADQTRVQAVGTEFNVRLRDADIAVTVIEGRVLVRQFTSKAGKASPSLEESLGRNEQAILNKEEAGNHPSMLKTASVVPERFISWRQKRLLFEAAPLIDVVADFNRYNSMELILSDRSLDDLSISGVFDPRDPETFARTLEAMAPVEVLVFGRSKILIKAL
ncbi:peptide ABC transporter substrate-binding protein [Iodidimonas muriae]|uniref:Peptide ABC transporter substrate-binding protein n=1 Tax=Iodidimonas muriae TaxID=261467 RepID=A0ABQ2L5Y8_9PROT|nr:FecR family protein [Iodidimonas muriae]GER06403.1 peptide ABC transporter substrate-binding protein [Kordiimonadales bacterium JCM 17843]GGO04636.1 peptide ABC transporter substrate-binding protein [Iodidimonas muriae]